MHVTRDGVGIRFTPGADETVCLLMRHYLDTPHAAVGAAADA